MKAEAIVIIPKTGNNDNEVNIDILPLILCKHCKHWNEDDHDCNIKVGHFTARPYWFCADGVEKDDN